MKKMWSINMQQRGKIFIFLIIALFCSGTPILTNSENKTIQR